MSRTDPRERGERLLKGFATGAVATIALLAVTCEVRLTVLDYERKTEAGRKDTSGLEFTVGATAPVAR